VCENLRAAFFGKLGENTLNVYRSNLSAAILVALASHHGIAQEARSGVSHPPEDTIITAAPVPRDNAATPLAKPSATQPLSVHPLSMDPVLRAASEPVSAPVAATRPLLRPDIDAGIVTRVSGPSNALPVGTLLKMSMNQTLSTLSTTPGTTFDGQLLEPLFRDGRILLPAGSLVSGRVTEVHGGRRISGTASLHLEPLNVTLPDGTRYPVHAQVIDTNLYRSTRVDREGTILRRDHAKQTATVLGLTAGSGAAAGAVFGGPAGALIGAGVGAGVGTVVWLKQDRQTALPPETIITFSLNRPLTVDAK
jgi:hypothetical protein